MAELAAQLCQDGGLGLLQGARPRGGVLGEQPVRLLLFNVALDRRYTLVWVCGGAPPLGRVIGGGLEEDRLGVCGEDGSGDVRDRSRGPEVVFFQ
jgi:hypothetical protein